MCACVYRQTTLMCVFKVAVHKRASAAQLQLQLVFIIPSRKLSPHARLREIALASLPIELAAVGGWVIKVEVSEVPLQKPNHTRLWATLSSPRRRPRLALRPTSPTSKYHHRPRELRDRQHTSCSSEHLSRASYHSTT